MFLATVIVLISCVEITSSRSAVQICSVFSSIKHAHDGSVVRADYKLVQFQLQQLIWWNCTVPIRFERWLQQCSGKIKHVPYFRANNYKIFSKTCATSFTFEQFHWFIQLCNETLQHFAGFGAFFVQSCDRFLFRLNFFSHFSLSSLIFFLIVVKFLIKQLFYSGLLDIKWL